MKRERLSRVVLYVAANEHGKIGWVHLYLTGGSSRFSCLVLGRSILAYPISHLISDNSKRSTFEAKRAGYYLVLHCDHLLKPRG